MTRDNDIPSSPSAGRPVRPQARDARRTLPEPYYSDGGIVLYHADCRDVLPGLEACGLLLTDPPYGLGPRVHDRANSQRGQSAAPCRDYGNVDWDNAPATDADCLAAIAICSSSIVWGGNYFQLGPSACWLVWDKDNGNNGYADCELAWTNIAGSIRRKRYRWMGMLQEHAGAHKEARVHPTQKPVAVMQWCISLAPSFDAPILDPFCGSGTTLVAAKLAGCTAVGIEISERYCEIAANRLRQGVLDFGGGK